MNETIPSQLARMDLERIKGYQELLDFYGGRQWEGRERRGERRLIFNYARVFVEKITAYLMTGITFAVDPTEDSEGARERARKAEAALYKVYADNQLEQLDLETEIDCAVLGDACYKVIWDAAEKRVRVTAPDVQGLYAWSSGDDISRVWRVASRYRLSAEEAELTYGLKPKGRTAAVTELWTERDFELYVDGAPVDAKANPYGFIPFVIFPNLREPKKFWGTSDLPPIMESQRELNRAMSQLSRILELSGNPIAVLENVEESEDIAIRPGAVWNIPEAARAYLLDLLQGGGVNLHINYIDLIYRALHDLSESPRSAFGGIERDLSGVALEIELQPLLQKVRRKRIIRTAAYNRRNEMILKLLEKYRGEDYGDNHLRVVWGPVLPKDLEKRVGSEQVMVQTGLHSRRTAMDELGVRDPDDEFQRWLEERESILKMNKEFNAKSARSGARESAGTARAEGFEE
ncbi:MAG TPA: phage portal protein [Dehalococcoidales bacterium]|nr:MAG: portal protein [Chloroflexi bacterium RBG_16_60_22]HJX11975.1 phage portal protein [Dehalococcoidales bacterium]